MTQRENVILVHGLWMHGLAMRLMRARLQRCGYLTHTYSYPSLRLTLDENAARLASYSAALESGTLHFVGHSMGGLIALAAAALTPPSRLGRIVLIGTPFADSFSGRRLERWPGGRRLLGKCMGQWLAGPRPELMRAAHVGVIAGTGGFGMGRLIAPTLSKPNDGVIALEETRVPGMRDHISLSVSHTAMIASREVVRQTSAFLKCGAFEREVKAAA